MKTFKTLARRVEGEWSKAGNKPAAFPEIATRNLKRFTYALKQAQLDRSLTDWLLKTSPLPEQVNLHNTFGQPPITIFNNGRFVVDLYLWVNFDTSIHSHGFRGAFRVLHGMSLHESFRVKTTKAVAPDLQVVDLGIPTMTLLEPGDVRTILPGRDLVHRVIHLVNPTVTLCVKTINEPDVSQWKYFPGGIAIRWSRPGPDLIKEIYYYDYLAGRRDRGAPGFLARILDRLDLSTSMNLLAELGALDVAEKSAEAVAAHIRKRHGKTAWFRKCENSGDPDDLHFERCTSPVGRLAAHMINGGHRFHDVRALFPGLAMWDVEKTVLALVDVEGIFEFDMSRLDRAGIKNLVRNPGVAVPDHLKPFGQIQKMRDFLS